LAIDHCQASASTLLKLLVPLLRCEMTDMKDTIVVGLGAINPASLACLLDELAPAIKVREPPRRILVICNRILSHRRRASAR